MDPDQSLLVPRSTFTTSPDSSKIKNDDQAPTASANQPPNINTSVQKFKAQGPVRSGYTIITPLDGDDDLGGSDTLFETWEDKAQRIAMAAESVLRSIVRHPVVDLAPTNPIPVLEPTFESDTEEMINTSFPPLTPMGKRPSHPPGFPEEPQYRGIGPGGDVIMETEDEGVGLPSPHFSPITANSDCIYEIDLEEDPSLATSYYDQPFGLGHMMSYLPSDHRKGRLALLSCNIPTEISGLPPDVNYHITTTIEPVTRIFSILVTYLTSNTCYLGGTPQTRLGISTRTISRFGKSSIVDYEPGDEGSGPVPTSKKKVIRLPRSRSEAVGNEYRRYIVERDQLMGLRSIDSFELIGTGWDLRRLPIRNSLRYMALKKEMRSLFHVKGSGEQTCKVWRFWIPEGWRITDWNWQSDPRESSSERPARVSIVFQEDQTRWWSLRTGSSIDSGSLNDFGSNKTVELEDDRWSQEMEVDEAEEAEKLQLILNDQEPISFL